MDTAPEPTAAPLVPQEPPEPSPLEMFDLNGRGLKVPLAEVLAMADKDCRYCTGGWQWTVLGERRTRRVCGCAIRLMRRKLAGETPSTSFVKVQKNPELERERVTKKIANLESIVAKLEAEVAEKIAGHDRGIAEAEAAVKEARLAHGRAGEEIIRQQNIASEIVHKIEALKQEFEEQRKVYDAAVDRAVPRLGELLARSKELEALRADSDRILDQAKPLRHRIERLQSKIALTKQQHADVLKLGAPWPSTHRPTKPNLPTKPARSSTHRRAR